jgi:hypothetical protein
MYQRNVRVNSDNKKYSSFPRNDIFTFQSTRRTYGTQQLPAFIFAVMLPFRHNRRIIKNILKSVLVYVPAEH